jgi:hypothetical protein
MATKIKIKHRAAKQALNDSNIIETFQDMIGGGPPSVGSLMIMVPKYEDMKRHSRRFIATLNTLANSVNLREKISVELDTLVPYIANLNDMMETSFNAPDMAPYYKGKGPGIEELIMDYSSTPDDVLANFGEEYRKTKESDIVRSILNTCGNLTKYKHYIGDKDKLTNTFLRTPGSSLRPIDNCSINFKACFNMIDENERTYLLMVMNKLYTVSHDLYEVVTSPDVNVDEFVHILVDNIDSLKKSIPRCNEAFDKIRDSIGMLKSNFNGYYRDFAASGNPSIIMENFVLDVSKTAGSDLRIVAQFRDIISHYKKISGSHSSNPKIQSLMKHIDISFKTLEERSREADEAAARGEVPVDHSDDDGDDEEEEVATGESGAADGEFNEMLDLFKKVSTQNTIDSSKYTE